MSGSHHTEPVALFVLEHARLNRGLSIRQAAKASGVAQETFRRLERGERIQPASAKKVADFFRVQVTDLMRAESESERAA